MYSRLNQVGPRWLKVASLAAVLGLSEGIPLRTHALPSVTSFRHRAFPIQGRVTDANGEALPGVSVRQKNSTIGTITDANGQFKLDVAQASDVLIFSFVGYSTQEVTVGSQKQLSVQLVSANQELNEVVVVGYAQVKKGAETSAVSIVKGVDLKNQHGVSFSERVQGLTPGLQISSNSGVEGGSVLVRLRGATSINAGNDPLYVIDGVFINSNSLQGVRTGGQTTNPLADINPNDIENIEVLKDANATAVYGARGANGVIIITTKRGSKNGKTKINFSTSVGVAKAPKLWDLTTGPQHAEILNEQWINDGNPAATRPFRPVSEGGQGNPQDQGTYDRLSLVFRTAVQQSNNLSITGGNEKTQFYLGGEVTNQNSILKLQDFQRLGFRVNVDHQINKKLQVGLSTSYSATKRQLARTGDTGGILNTGLHTPTLTPLFAADGSYNRGERFNNPYVLLENSNNYAYGKHLIANAYLKWNLTKDLTFKSSWSLDDNYYNEAVYYNANLTEGRATNGSATNATTLDRTWIAEQLLNYIAPLGEKHFLTVFLGNTLQRNEFQRSTITGTNFPSTQFTTISAAAITTGSTTGITPSGLISYFGGANYSFDSRYSVDLNVRTDASSRFGANNRWGTFPSAGVSWRLGQERFIRENVRFVNDLKLKASIGWTGNQSIPDFASLGLWSGGNNYLDRPGVSPAQLANQNLKWETTRQWNVGLEAALFANRLKFEWDVYNKYTTDLLLQVPIPAKTGFSSSFQNLGEMSNKGFEFQITSVNISSNKLEWTTSFNVAHNVNTIEKLPISFTQYNRDWVRLQEGQPMYSFWLYKQLYVDPQTGNAVYDDSRTKDGKITTDDRQIVGNAWPAYYGGLRNSFRFNSFDFSFFFYFSQGNKVFNMNRYFQEHAGSRGTSWSLLASQMRRWQQPGDVTDIPRVTILPNADGSYNHNFESSRFLEDASFIRLRSVALGYSLPTAILSKVRLQQARLYVNATNLLTFTKYSGPDPEINTAQDYANATVQGLDFSMPPHPRTVEVGLNLTF
ncbi:SusC/RagA family TonB-linked outer membrane protein [Siphonobacter curvatus]|uniref:TonB-dependent receptor n=1 Tax=Siphonobacter curvatus TaxID=2094562 RepID=A0A2S7IGH0_9BACT|nr:TonB-dependent receptor [Siphonobacter curvatus]PQA54461.1 TonB-dependent receptor [Siphonobacter curvatus]